MKLEVTNPNYCATVVKIQSVLPLEGSDNLVAVPFFGYQAIVSKDIDQDQLYILFTAECQLSEGYCKNNNLYRKPELNSDIEAKPGYIEDKRRIKAVKLRGHISSALLMPVSSLSSLVQGELQLGDTFNTIDGVEICKKYEIAVKGSRENRVGGKNKVFTRVDAKTFPEHLDTENYWRNKHFYKDGDMVSATQKLHGTSGRFGHIKVRRATNFVENVLKKFGIAIDEYEYDYIAGSRRVVKDAKVDKEHSGYYASDLWNKVLAEYKDRIPKNWIIYGEIIGWDGEKQIQKDYTYNLPQGQMAMYVYRIAIVNEDGISCDLTYDQMTEFCSMSGFNIVPLLWYGAHKDFVAEDWTDKTYFPTHKHAVPLCDKSPCDEGVVVRRDGIQPFVTKAKSPIFLGKESADLDLGVEDLESTQS